MTPIPLMTPYAWESQVRDRARFLRMISIGGHAIDQMVARNITNRMVQRVLLNGTVAKGPVWDNAHTSHVGTMRGTAAGTRLDVVCAIQDGNMTVTVVTTHMRSRK